MKRFLDYRISIRQIMYLVIAIGIPYCLIGLIWLFTHDSHLENLHGLDWFFSVIGEIIAWPPLVISDITLR
ncbi:hypothetical protein [Smaragdicoccus niigatensis]|uniref:hypothetical protein n=1 Tax=Smaragdicoccus niigatensis TaxID=359359 RepID=UPI00035E86F5|nr:hypothetical protein [Smaragdicoccus niigatensis]